MIYPKFTHLSDTFWKWYIHRIIKSDFHEFTSDLSFEVDEGKSILILGNHFSWWDGFFIYELNRLLFKKRFHVMMTERELKKNGFLRTAGAYSINKTDGRKMLESLKYSAELLEKPGNLVLMFPQGQIESQHRESLTFQSGLMRIIKQSPSAFQLIFCTNLTDYYSNRKPTLKAFLKLHEGELNLENIHQAFQQHYQESKEKMREIVS